MVTLGQGAAELTSGGGPGGGQATVGRLLNGGQLLSREAGRAVVSSGFRGLDSLLPAGGVRPGSLIELFGGADVATAGSGAATLACAVACRLARTSTDASCESSGRSRTIVVVDRNGWFHPPAVLPWLGDECRLVVARPSHDDDEIWTIDQAVRCTGVAAVLAWPRPIVRGPRHDGRGRLRPAASLQQWTTAMRRWQLAAASSGAVGFFVRPDAARHAPSWAEARIVVSPQASVHDGGALLERRLRLVAAGGAWSAADPDTERSAEVVLDLARGVEAPPRPSSLVRERSPIRRDDFPRLGQGVEPWSFIDAGVTCRAS
jgi:hypothetical protein